MQILMPPEDTPTGNKLATDLTTIRRMDNMSSIYMLNHMVLVHLDKATLSTLIVAFCISEHVDHDQVQVFVLFCKQKKLHLFFKREGSLEGYLFTASSTKNISLDLAWHFLKSIKFRLKWAIFWVKLFQMSKLACKIIVSKAKECHSILSLTLLLNVFNTVFLSNIWNISQNKNNPNIMKTGGQDTYET